MTQFLQDRPNRHFTHFLYFNPTRLIWGSIRDPSYKWRLERLPTKLLNFEFYGSNKSHRLKVLSLNKINIHVFNLFIGRGLILIHIDEFYYNRFPVELRKTLATKQTQREHSRGIEFSCLTNNFFFFKLFLLSSFEKDEKLI